MNRLPDLINIAKCNIFAIPVSFNTSNCFGKFSISKLLGFPMITVWVLAIVSQKFVCMLKDFKWMRSMLLQNTLNLDIKLCIAYIHTKKPLLSFQKMKYVALNQRGALWILYYIHNPSSIDLWQQMFLLCKANKKMKKLFWSQSFLYPSIQ